MFTLFVILISIYILCQITEYFLFYKIRLDAKKMGYKGNVKLNIPLLYRIIPIAGISVIIQGFVQFYIFVFHHKIYVQRQQMKKTMLAMAKYEQQNFTKNKIKIPKGSSMDDNPMLNAFKKAGYNMNAQLPVEVINGHH